MDSLLAAHPGEVRHVYRHYPLPMHEYAARAAQASIEAQRQDRFWPYHDRLFENQQALADADLVGHAQSLGLDADAVERALAEGTYQARMQADVALGLSLGVTGTPTFYLNGFRFQGVPRLWMLEIALEAFRTGLLEAQPSPGDDPTASQGNDPAAEPASGDGASG